MNRGALNVMKHVPCRTGVGLAGVLLVTTIFASSAQPAMADTHRLAYSDKLKVDIEALGGANWCSPQLMLYLNMDPASSLVGHVAAQIQLLNRLGGIIESQCPQALAAGAVTQVTNGGIDTVEGSYIATASSNWQFSTRTPAVSSAAATQKTPLGLGSASASGNASPAAPQQGVPLPSAAAPALPPPAFVLPTYTGYAAVLLHYLKDNPSEASDPQVIQWWTAQSFPDEYRAVQFQEFKLQPVLQEGQANLSKALSQSDDGVVVLLQASLGTYDFAKNQYPLTLNDGTILVNPPWGNATPPVNGFQINADLDNIMGLPMSQSAAAAYEEAHTSRFGSVDRNVIIAIKLKLAPGTFAGQAAYNPTANAMVESAAIYAASVPFGQNNPSAETPVAIITANQIDAVRNAKIAAAAAAARAQLLAQRSTDIQEVAGFTNGQKLYNWLNDSQLSPDTLNNIGQARWNAILANQPVPVSMLVEAGGSGKQDVPTAWPGHLALNATGNIPAFSGSNWYLVSGSMTTSTRPGDLTSTLDVTNFYQCKQDQCAEALDPASIVERHDAVN